MGKKPFEVFGLGCFATEAQRASWIMIHVMRRSGSLYSLILFFSILVIVLNPYTIYGKPGMFAAGCFFIYAIKSGLDRAFFKNFILPSLLLFVLSLIGASASFLNDIPQLNHPFAVISFFVMIITAYGIFLYCMKHKLSMDDLLVICLLVIVLNSLIILLELQFDEFRSFIESYLDPLSGSAINYASGFRFRGLAASGGAGLSVLAPAGILIALHLFDKGRLSAFFLAILILSLLASVVVIGRTGIVLSAIPIGTYFLLFLSREQKFSSILKSIIFLTIVFLIIFPLFYEYVANFFAERFDDDFVKYAFGFLLEGSNGIEDEGTVGVMAEFIKVLPMEFPQVLTGYGFYGGSEFYPWTDAGFNRTFLSVGFLFGSIFYVIVFYMYFLTFRINKYLIGSFVLVLTIAEIKEPLLFSGFASRMFILIFVYYYCEDKYLKAKKI